MKEKVRFAFSIFWVLVGAVLCGLGVAEVIDSFWSGMGGGLVGVGLVQTVRHIRYRKDPEYREKTDTENQDERNRFIGVASPSSKKSETMSGSFSRCITEAFREYPFFCKASVREGS